MSNNTQLPAEVLARVDDEAKKFAFYNYVTPVLQPDAEFDNFDTWPEQARVCYYSILHYMTRPDICWPYSELTLAAEYATKLHMATEYLNLLLSAQLCDLKAPDHLINEIKTFLDGTK